MKAGHRHAEFSEPLRKAGHHGARPDDSELSEGVDDEAEPNRDSPEKKGEIDEERVCTVEKRAEIHS